MDGKMELNTLEIQHIKDKVETNLTLNNLVYTYLGFSNPLNESAHQARQTIEADHVNNSLAQATGKKAAQHHFGDITKAFDGLNAEESLVMYMMIVQKVCELSDSSNGQYADAVRKEFVQLNKEIDSILKEKGVIEYSDGTYGLNDSKDPYSVTPFVPKLDKIIEGVGYPKRTPGKEHKPPFYLNNPLDFTFDSSKGRITMTEAIEKQAKHFNINVEDLTSKLESIQKYNQKSQTEIEYDDKILKRLFGEELVHQFWDKQEEVKFDLNESYCAPVERGADSLKIMAISFDTGTRQPIGAQEITYSADGKQEMSRKLVELNTAFEQIAQYAEKHPFENNDTLKKIGFDEKYFNKKFRMSISGVTENDRHCEETLIFSGGTPPDGKYPVQINSIHGAGTLNRYITVQSGIRMAASLSQAKQQDSAKERGNYIQGQQQKAGNLGDALKNDPYLYQYDAKSFQANAELNSAIVNRNKCIESREKWEKEHPIRNFLHDHHIFPSREKKVIQGMVFEAEVKVQSCSDQFTKAYNDRNQCNENMIKIFNGKNFESARAINQGNKMNEHMKNVAQSLQNKPPVNKNRGNENGIGY